MNARALKFVRHDAVPDHLSAGWMVSIPNAYMHHHHYSIELAWLCACPVPGGFKISKTAFPQSNQENAQNERATEHRTA